MNGCHDDDWLISRFRFPKAISSWKSTELGPGLERQTARSHALPVPIQVLTTLGFLATGSFQRELADRAIAAVLNGIIRISASKPSTHQSAICRDRRFSQFGAIDCTHIAIKAPSEGEYAYVNRKHFHSLNVQIICDAQMRTNIVARWPGSTHDSFVLTNSSVGNRFRTRQEYKKGGELHRVDPPPPSGSSCNNRATKHGLDKRPHLKEQRTEPPVPEPPVSPGRASGRDRRPGPRQGAGPHRDLLGSKGLEGHPGVLLGEPTESSGETSAQLGGSPLNQREGSSNPPQHPVGPAGFFP
ncbi:putative nuclease HARBI1 [Merluccius polli]|uniref:Nuclease HARBI1 n=1 Tax=Merluccius polli TaxID=89951 RepID=A0AA47P4H6_MERPO|nr:putative nuclease HARBI1 [Merluccius polli]